MVGGDNMKELYKKLYGDTNPKNSAICTDF